MQHSQKHNRDKLLDKAYQQYLDSLDNLIDTAIDEFNELIDPRFQHQIQMSPEDAMISILKEKAAWADYIANTYYNTMRQIWAEESDLDMPDMPELPTVDYRRTVWKIAHGLNDTDYPGLKFTDVINDKAHGYTMADIWQRAINKTLPKPKPGYTQAQHNEDLESFISEFLEQQARLSMRNRIEADPSKPRWARIPRGLKTCAFCYMLASRGFVYHDEEKAGGRMHDYHPHCDCQVIPSWGEQTIRGYDPAKMRENWDRAYSVAPGGYKQALAVLRRLYPDILKDGVRNSTMPQWEGQRVAPRKTDLAQLSNFNLHMSGDKFTAQEKIRALVKWTDNGSSWINGALFGEKPMNEGIQRIIAQIDEALADHTTSKAFTVDRLMDIRTFGASNIAALFRLTPGQTFTHEGFMATSLNSGGVEATPSQRVATRILVAPGEHAAFLENITRYPGEKEILLKRGRTLKFVNLGKLPNGELLINLALVPREG